eukprot:5004692-Prymnesium_polylepis.2
MVNIADAVRQSIDTTPTVLSVIMHSHVPREPNTHASAFVAGERPRRITSHQADSRHTRAPASRQHNKSTRPPESVQLADTTPVGSCTARSRGAQEFPPPLTRLWGEYTRRWPS